MSFDPPPSVGPGPRWAGDGSLTPRDPTPEDHPASPAHRTFIDAPAPGRRAREVLIAGQTLVLASPLRRAGAFTIDFFLRYLILQVMLAILGVPSSDVTVNVFVGAQLWASGWNVIFFTQGWTPGARVMRIRIVRLSDGSAPGLRAGVVRSAGVVLSEVVFLLGYLWAFWDVRRQTWHDKFAGTVVVEVPPAH